MITYETLLHSPQKEESLFSEKIILNKINDNINDSDSDKNLDFFTSYNFYTLDNNAKETTTNFQNPSLFQNNLNALIQENKNNDEEKEKNEWCSNINGDNDLYIINKVIKNLNLDEKDNIPTKSKFDFTKMNNNDTNEELINNNNNFGKKEILSSDEEKDFFNKDFNLIFNKSNSEKKVSKFNFVEIDEIFSQNNINQNCKLPNMNNNKNFYNKSNSDDKNFFNIDYNKIFNKFSDGKDFKKENINSSQTINNKNYDNNYSNEDIKNKNQNQITKTPSGFFNQNNTKCLINNFNYINSFQIINNSNIYFNNNNKYNNLPDMNIYNSYSYNTNFINDNLLNEIQALNYNNISNNNSYKFPFSFLVKSKNIKDKKIKNFNIKNDVPRNYITDIKELEYNIEKGIELIDFNKNENISEKEKEENKNNLSRIKTEILMATKDVSGNYSIQKIINTKDFIKINFIIDSIKTKILELTLHLYGCRVIQELISVLDEKDINKITSELKPFYNKCIEDKNGNHVIQRLIEKLSPEQNNDIFSAGIKNIINLSKHQYGCRVIQRLFKYCNDKQINQMLKEIYLYINELIIDQYGNYVIQYILENNRKNNELNEIYQSLKGHIYDYSFHKFASNVIEKALSYGDQKQKNEIIKEIMLLEEKENDVIISLVKDKFGNYVIQKIMEYSDPVTKQKIIQEILKNENLVRNEGFSKHVIKYIQKLKKKI